MLKMLQSENSEVRSLPFGFNANEEQRQKGDNKLVISGYAMRFDETALISGWDSVFEERFHPNCLTETLADGHKIMLLYNHYWSEVLGSTAGNVRLENRKDGLYFEYEPMKFEKDLRILELIRNGTIDGCSIGFRVEKDKWEKVDYGVLRTIEKISLYEITLTPIPAYTTTSVKVDEALNSRNTNKAAIDEERSFLLAEINQILGEENAPTEKGEN